jgi:hypothetical protein
MTWFRDNGLSLTLFALFPVTVVGHAWTGWIAGNEELIQEGFSPISLTSYLTGGGARTASPTIFTLPAPPHGRAR